MRKHNGILTGCVLGAVVGAAIGAAADSAMARSASPLKTVAYVDLDRYVGRWFEIARYANRFERKCARDVTAEYSVKQNGEIRVVNGCVTRGGKVTQSEGTARVVDTATNAKLKVAFFGPLFFWPFSGNYWVIDLGSDYEYSVVGEPSRDYLWILSRSPAMDDSVYRKITGRLQEQGYDPAKLVKTVQTAAGQR